MVILVVEEEEGGCGRVLSVVEDELVGEAEGAEIFEATEETA